MNKSKNRDYTGFYIGYVLSMVLMAGITYFSQNVGCLFWTGICFLALGLTAIIFGKIIESYGKEIIFTMILAVVLIVLKIGNWVMF